jgi:predicted unusual protein kinase regulating ubiquinone biosynthesis (AarF/ABC1/UbiB family)
MSEDETKQNSSGRSARAISVPSSRLGRLAGFGMMTAGIAGRGVFEGAKRLSRGEVPSASELLLTPTNVLKLSDELSRMRGAALKLGQLISMDAGEFLPPELASIMARLRANADFMPQAQLIHVLKEHWGENWQGPFEAFDMHPIAAASIGQVHQARLKDGKAVAVKVQYPGVKNSIDSDIDNVVALFKLSGFAPPSEKLVPLVQDAKQQLQQETDYLREADMTIEYANCLSRDDQFALPMPLMELTTGSILTMAFLPGRAIEKTAYLMPDVRNGIVETLIRLCLREVFEFGLMQSDPNFANYTYDTETGIIGLLDFGATVALTPEAVSGYRELLKAGMAGNRDGVKETALSLGIFSTSIKPEHETQLLDMVMTVFSEIMREETYDFSKDQLMDGIRMQGMALATDKAFNEIPPTEVIYLQRKVAGMYLLGSKLKAKVGIRAMLEDHVSD